MSNLPRSTWSRHTERACLYQVAKKLSGVLSWTPGKLCDRTHEHRVDVNTLRLSQVVGLPWRSYDCDANIHGKQPEVLKLSDPKGTQAVKIDLDTTNENFMTRRLHSTRCTVWRAMDVTTRPLQCVSALWEPLSKCKCDLP